MNLVQAANQQIRKSDLVYYYEKDNVTTTDIINAILYVDSTAAQDVAGFAKHFTKDRQGLRKLFHFVKDNIKYIEDAKFSDTQYIKSPGALWKMKSGDCKSYTVFIRAVLQALNIPSRIKFVSYYKNKPVTHVYPIATINGRDIILDAVYGYFDQEDHYSYAVEYKKNLIGNYKMTTGTYAKTKAHIGTTNSKSNFSTILKIAATFTAVYVISQ